MTHNGRWHNESIYLKWEYDQKLKGSRDDSEQIDSDESDKDLDVEANADRTTSDDDREANEIDDIANLCLVQKKFLFDKYELADIVIQAEFENQTYE